MIHSNHGNAFEWKTFRQANDFVRIDRHGAMLIVRRALAIRDSVEVDRVKSKDCVGL